LRTFLTAEWRDLVLFSFETQPAMLEPYLPPGVELDDWRGRTFFSLIGFRFLESRLLGVAIPFHGNFPEVNLRFYVRRRTESGWRRAVHKQSRWRPVANHRQLVRLILQRQRE
jgi:hypothetical protein